MHGPIHNHYQRLCATPSPVTFDYNVQHQHQQQFVPKRLAINIHLLHHDQRVRIRPRPTAHLVHRHVPADLLLRDDPLVQIRRRAAGELVVARLLDPLVRLDVVAQQLRRLPRLDHTHIHIAPRPEVVEDAGLDGVGADLDRLVARAVLRPLRLEDGHGG